MMPEKRPLMDPEGLCISEVSSADDTYYIAFAPTVSELVEREKTVNHRTIITVGGTSQDDKEEHQVSASQVLQLEPSDGGEFLPCYSEVALGH